MLGIKAIDLVICNLYDFASASATEDAELIEILEKIDIGGSTLIRSAAKNFAHVAVVTDPADYLAIVQEMHSTGGCLSIATRARLAAKAMNASADYDSLIACELSRRLLQEDIRRPKLINGRPLRYGENPDQQAWVYQFENETGVTQAEVLGGKELSYNNYEDATAAYHAAQELSSLEVEHGVAVVKHGGLCGFACADSLVEAFQLAWAGDPKSAFGSVIAFCGPVDESLIPEVENKFIEVLIAADFSPEFLQWALQNKRSLRLLKTPMKKESSLFFKKVSGGMLVQTAKRYQTPLSIRPLLKPASPKVKRKIGVVTERQPEAEQGGLYNFALAAVKCAKSNAVAIVRASTSGSYQLLGMGAGQPNRVDSLERLALPKAIDGLRTENANKKDYDPKQDLEKCVLASDGFFPFADSVTSAAQAGLLQCIQPGGSIRDQEVIEAADRSGMCMIFSGERSFSH
jgi:phosphoribosylaminoimidazolecarboxamide formyltransferase/IMP cyclohydrolase